MKVRDAIVYAVARVLEAADAWEVGAGPTRCPGCGTRIHRSAVELKLAAAVLDWRACLRKKRHEKFEEEAPTRPKKK